MISADLNNCCLSDSGSIEVETELEIESPKASEYKVICGAQTCASKSVKRLVVSKKVPHTPTHRHTVTHNTLKNILLASTP